MACTPPPPRILHVSAAMQLQLAMQLIITTVQLQISEVKYFFDFCIFCGLKCQALIVYVLDGNNYKEFSVM